jgi:hypothetical protein
MQSNIPKLGAGVFVAAMLALLTAASWERAAMNVIYVIKELALQHVNKPVAEIFEFVALMTWAVIVTVILVVVAMKQGKKSEA